MDLLKALDAIARDILEFLSWRDDWNRTWSPVSFWLAVATAVPLLVCCVIFWHEIANAVLGWLGYAH